MDRVKVVSFWEGGSKGYQGSHSLDGLNWHVFDTNVTSGIVTCTCGNEIEIISNHGSVKHGGQK
jgi:hypothetical protein